jgi:hypothetical protein
VLKPEVYFEQIDPDAEGRATLWYRSREDAGKARDTQDQDAVAAAGWKSIRLEAVESYPHRVNPMSVLPDGRLYGTGDDYAERSGRRQSGSGGLADVRRQRYLFLRARTVAAHSQYRPGPVVANRVSA